jgi:ribonucleoside-diphosphate reductase alpha chain
MHISPQAHFLLSDRYLLPSEKPTDLVKRVANALDTDKTKDFLYVMENFLFLPNSPTLMNAGTPKGQLSACFVLPVEDSIESIFTTLAHMALIHQSGGGTGFSFSHIRPKGDTLGLKGGVASGPLSFIRVFDSATNAVRQGGKRRGANMGVLSSSHPDIFAFIHSKREGGLNNFNLSVGFDEEFFHCLDTSRPYPLVNPRDGSVWDEPDPSRIWNEISAAAWASGEPGVLFLDEINRTNTLPKMDFFEATNPCGEQPLFPYESCNLGSVNLARCIRKHDIDSELLTYCVRTGVEFLDRVIDVNHFPLTQIREKTLQSRKIGLGVMGLAEMLIKLGIPYESKEALALAEQVMECVHTEARQMSHELGEWKGSFPAIDQSVFSTDMRNATVTTIAPTGSLHIIADTTSGIEPLFSVAYERRIGKRYIPVFNRLFREFAQKHPRANSIIDEVRTTGSVQHLHIGDEVKELFKTAWEISPEHHVRMQAVVQKHIDNAVSKTVNMPECATPDDVKGIFELARSMGCKGITIYRYNSKADQVLTQGCSVCSLERESC